MAEEKTSWDNIPSLDDLEVDWSFEPENPLGKRGGIRVEKRDLFSLLGIKNIPLKVVSKDFDEKGSLVDLDQYGLAVLLDTKLALEQIVKIGFFLGKQKIISRAVVRNVSSSEGKYRTGIQFIDLQEEYETAIVAIVTSKNYKSL